ncbi:acetylglutamate kinase [Lewinella sp. LCG006]|uniref:acetylglutamate kinase n=1 Tax=Lewinella sp. LCG006 TaxID=3231911 RepID=UPI003460D946
MLRILKIGGNVLADPLALDQALSFFADYQSPAILVHGGGREASDLLKKMGHEAKMVNGRRITDAATLEVVTMVYAGLLNKQLVAQLQAKNCNALGVTGADGNLIRAHKRIVKDIDYGFAGDIDAVNTAGFKSLLEGGFSPVCCAITHDKQGQLLNTNADTIASSIAVALAAAYEVELLYCFEKPGVLMDAEDNKSVIGHLNPTSYAELKQEGIVHSGMLPKLDNAFAAIANGVKAVYVGNLESLGNGKATRLSW